MEWSENRKRFRKSTWDETWKPLFWTEVNRKHLASYQVAITPRGCAPWDSALSKVCWRWRNQFLVDNSRVEMCVIMKRRQPLLLLRNWLVWEMQNRHQHQSPKKGCPSEQSTLHLVRWSTEVLAPTASPVINYHSNLVLHQNYTVKSGDCKLLLLDTSRTTYPFL